MKPKIIQVYNKKNKTTYLYEDIAYWDPELKQGRHKRKGIGKLDANGKPVYNNYYLNRYEKQTDEETLVVSSTALLGERLILDKIIADTNLKPLLTKTLGKENASLALQLIRYSVCEGKPLCYAEDWLKGHGFNSSALNSRRIPEFLGSLNKEIQNNFFVDWIAQNIEQESLLFDIRSISSYAKQNQYGEGGFLRDHEGVEQLNIALMGTCESYVPLCYTELPGGVSDQFALEYIGTYLEKLGFRKIGFFLDRDFYSGKNIQKLTQNNLEFTMAVPFHIKWQNDFIDRHRGELQSPSNLIKTESEDSTIYGLTAVITSKYGKMVVHLYYDAVRKERDVARLKETLKKCQEDLENGREFKSRKHYYKQYFRVRKSPTLGSKVILKEDEVDAYINGYSGYLVLLSTNEKDATKALSHYRQRRNIELHFDNMKNLLDCNSFQVHSEEMMQGRLFLNFLTLIVVNELKRFIAEIPPADRNGWDHKTILNKVASYSRIRYKNKHQDVFSAPNKSQRLIFDLFGIKYTWKGKVVNDGIE